jgi:chemotaxis protein histidine kinase CheA
MVLSGIISISGRPGLYKVVAQGKNNVIVESLEDKKRFPAYSTDRISALEDISIYTYAEDQALHEIFDSIFKKEEGKICISHKESENNLAKYLESVLPEYDKERVYPSDVKKIFMWYNLLHKAGELKQEKEEETVSKKEDSKEESVAEKPKKETKAKTVSAAKPKVAAKPTSKSTAGKKSVSPKGGTSRGK